MAAFVDGAGRPPPHAATHLFVPILAASNRGAAKAYPYRPKNRTSPRGASCPVREALSGSRSTISPPWTFCRRSAWYLAVEKNSSQPDRFTSGSWRSHRIIFRSNEFFFFGASDRPCFSDPANLQMHPLVVAALLRPSADGLPCWKPR